METFSNRGSVVPVIVDELPNPRLSHHSHATVVGNLIFVSGLVSQPDSDGAPPGVLRSDDGPVHDVSLQLTSIFQQLDVILQECNSQRELVVDVQVFLRDLKTDFETMNESYKIYFGLHMPSRTTVEVVRFPSEVAVEIKVIAAVNQSINREVTI